MRELITQLKRDFPAIQFTASSRYMWQPDKQIVHFSEATDDVTAQWSLLHELSHGVLSHQTYRSDIALLLMEAEAWEKASELANSYLNPEQQIDPDHIQDCLDTYRDWLYARSKCPKCEQTGLQSDPATYQCINCRQSWRVSGQRFHRPYRMCIQSKIKTSPAQKSETAKFY